MAQDRTSEPHINDMGLFIADSIDGEDMIRFQWAGDVCGEEIGCDEITGVNRDDPSNLRIYTASGASFRVTITKEG